MGEKEVKKSTINVLKKSRFEFFYKFFISVVIRGLLLVIPLLFSEAINLVTEANYTMGIFYLVLSIVIIIIYKVCDFINYDAFYMLYNKLFYEYNLIALKSTFQNSLFSLSRFDAGEYNNMLDDDVVMMSNFFSNLVLKIVQILELFFVYYYFYTIDFKLFIMSIIISVVSVIGIILTIKPLTKSNEINKKTSDIKTSSTLEFYDGIREIKTFNLFNLMSEKNNKAFKKSNQAATNLFSKFYGYNSIILGIIEVFRYLMVIYGVLLVKDNLVDIGILLIIYNYYQKIIDSFTQVLVLDLDYIYFKVSMKRFNRLLEYKNPPMGNRDIRYNEIKGIIEFKNVLYGYRDDPTLENVSFKINPNTITVITGREGFGKRGIFDLLMRFNRQHEGKILIDNIDINEYKENDYFHLISMSSQKPVFFNDTIKNNLLMIDPDEENVLKVLKELKIDNDILESKDKMNTMMNSEETNLTTTLLNMLSIARVLIKDSKIMLFDESISTLDKNKQNIVMERLNELKKDHTILMISREKNIIKYADQIIEIEGTKLK